MIIILTIIISEFPFASVSKLVFVQNLPYGYVLFVHFQRDISTLLSWLSGDDKLRSWRRCFSTRQQLNNGRSLPILYLNSWLRFTAAVTSKTVKITLMNSWSHAIWPQWLALVSRTQKTANHFLFHGRKRNVTYADCVCFFNRNEIKVCRALRQS